MSLPDKRGEGRFISWTFEPSIRAGRMGTPYVVHANTAITLSLHFSEKKWTRYVRRNLGSKHALMVYSTQYADWRVGFFFISIAYLLSVTAVAWLKFCLPSPALLGFWNASLFFRIEIHKVLFPQFLTKKANAYFKIERTCPAALRAYEYCTLRNRCDARAHGICMHGNRSPNFLCCLRAKPTL